MMRSILMTSVAAAMLLSGAANASTVYNTSLPNVNTTVGSGTATTTTNANGTLTTVVGPSGGGNRVSAPFASDKWLQSNVGADASLGVTKTYARSGNGSAYFDGPTPQSQAGSGSKADLEYYFSQPLLLSDFVSATYDWFRDSSSTNNGIQTASFRFLVNTAGLTLPTSTALIFEPYYQGAPGNVATDQWVTSAIDGNSIFWNNNGVLANGSSGMFSSLSSIIAANSGLYVYGLSTGIGSGWDGHFTGAVDNIGYNFGARADSFNFEVAAVGGAVPEPASWAMMIGGLGVVGASMRRRKVAMQFA